MEVCALWVPCSSRWDVCYTHIQKEQANLKALTELKPPSQRRTIPALSMVKGREILLSYHILLRVWPKTVSYLQLLFKGSNNLLVHFKLLFKASNNLLVHYQLLFKESNNLLVHFQLLFKGSNNLLVPFQHRSVRNCFPL